MDWSGSYSFRREDAFFCQIVKVGRRYADAQAQGKAVPASSFDSELSALRQMAPRDGEGLLGDLAHRWARPHAPPTLYVLTCELTTEADCVFMAGGETLGTRIICTKVGQAKRSLAGRLAGYAVGQILGGSPITPGSLVLQTIVYGYGPGMLTQRDVKRIALANGSALKRVSKAGRPQRCSSEAYVGHGIGEAVVALARERSSA